MNFHNLAANQSEIRETSFSDPGIYRDPEIGDLSETITQYVFHILILDQKRQFQNGTFNFIPRTKVKDDN